MKTYLLQLLLTCFYISTEVTTDYQKAHHNLTYGYDPDILVKTTRWMHLFWMPIFVYSERIDHIGYLATQERHTPEEALFI